MVVPSSYPRILLWLAFFLAATTFAPLRSSAFTYPPSSHIRLASAQQRHTTAAATTITTTTSLASMVVDAPVKTKEEKETKTVEILNDDTTEDETNYGGEGWEIRLWNDPFNKREFVAMCLATICGKSDTESYQIMMQAHNNGMGVIGRYNFEIAELYFGSLKESGLTVDMIQVDDE